MYYKNCFAFLTAFSILFLLSAGMSAQMERSRVDSLSANMETDNDKSNRIVAQRTYGPHYKNPLAAGRIVKINSTTPVAVKPLQRVKLTGPAYKNRVFAADKVNATSPDRAAKRTVTGPRYKNRSAKSN